MEQDKNNYNSLSEIGDHLKITYIPTYLLATAAESSDWECAEENWIMSCIECGCCQSTCPSRRPLLDWVRLAKNRVGGIIRARNAKK